jgi:hypothetical protein
MQTPSVFKRWSLHVVILSKCVFVFEIFFFGWGIVPTPHENFSNFFDPPPEMFAQIIRKKGFFFLRLSPPEMVDFDLETKKKQRTDA